MKKRDREDPAGAATLGESEIPPDEAEPRIASGLTGGESQAAAASDEPAEERSYFRALEDHLAGLRQGWLLLTPADWLVARNWRKQGIPLDLVRRTMEELYARRVERGSKRRINSLRYFARAVEAAWEEISSLTAPGRRQAVPPLDVPARLAALAQSLPELPGRAQLVKRILTLGGDTELVEAALATLDREILTAAEGAPDGPGREELLAAEASTLARLAGRLPEEEIAAARLRLRAQVLRRRLGLPVLSLFSPEAHPAGYEEPAPEPPSQES